MFFFFYVSVSEKRRVARPRINYVPWNKEEVTAVERFFAVYFLTLERPLNQQFEDFMAAEPVAMKRRTLKNVRDRVQTRITTLRKSQAKQAAAKK
jgi:hypothetical protein